MLEAQTNEIKCDWNKWFLFFSSSHRVVPYGRDVMFEFIFGFWDLLLYVALRPVCARATIWDDDGQMNRQHFDDDRWIPLVVCVSFLLHSPVIGGDYINRCWFIDFNISNNKHSFKIFPPLGVCSLLWCDFSLQSILFHFTFSCCSNLVVVVGCVSISFGSLFKFPAKIYILYRRPICV